MSQQLGVSHPALGHYFPNGSTQHTGLHKARPPSFVRGFGVREGRGALGNGARPVGSIRVGGLPIGRAPNTTEYLAGDVLKKLRRCLEPHKPERNALPDGSATPLAHANQTFSCFGCAAFSAFCTFKNQFRSNVLESLPGFTLILNVLSPAVPGSSVTSR